MKYKIIISLICVAWIVWILWIIQYKNYIDFLGLYNTWEYSTILANSPVKSPEMLHNYGNASFKSFTASGYINPTLLQQANEYFSWSLQLEENEDTRYNYDLTKSLLELYKQDDIPEDPNQKSDETQWENSQNSQEWESWENQQQVSPSQNGRDNEYFLDSQDEIAPLNAKEQEQLNQSIDELKRDQMRNQQFYWKQQQLSPFQEAFESIFWGIERGDEKDW